MSRGPARGDDALAEYRARREAAATPEPVPEGRSGRGPRSAACSAPAFVVQEHHARALHWDFRLERDGVLVSWAVPKGLPPDRTTNHLAVHTEDHPMEYLTFAGTIPAGEYGGGEVTVWDAGTYETEKWNEREVMVTLDGTLTGRARGRYVLFHTKAKNWMIHRMDDAPPGYEPMPSVMQPMLAVLAEQVPAKDKGWNYEFKWDGIRAITYVDGGRVTIVSRNGNDLTTSFPELRALGEHLGSDRVVLDGEIVAFDSAGRPSFQLLQPRLHSGDAAKARRAAERQAATLVVFDLLYVNGSPLVDEPYAKRRQLLEAIGLERGGSWTVSPRFDGPGADILGASEQQGLEGILAKRLDSPYRPGRRSRDWLKVKNVKTQEAVIGGFTPGQGRRANRIGSLLLGIPGDAGLAYVGQVGTGFTEEALDDLARRLAPLEADRSPFAGEVPSRYRKGARWTRPELVGEVRYGEWTSDGRLRHPSWRGLREDKHPEEVVREP